MREGVAGLTRDKTQESAAPIAGSRQPPWPTSGWTVAARVAGQPIGPAMTRACRALLSAARLILTLKVCLDARTVARWPA
jgi:hypothetical protein